MLLIRRLAFATLTVTLGMAACSGDDDGGDGDGNGGSGGADAGKDAKSDAKTGGTGGVGGGTGGYGATGGTLPGDAATEDGPSCVLCSGPFSGQGFNICTDNGPPSSAAKMGKFRQCMCKNC